MIRQYFTEMRCHWRMLRAAWSGQPFPGHLPACGLKHRQWWLEHEGYI